MKMKVEMAATVAKLTASFLQRRLLIPLLVQPATAKYKEEGQMIRIQTSQSQRKICQSTLP